jgi:hypothetical protein
MDSENHVERPSKEGKGYGYSHKSHLPAHFDLVRPGTCSGLNVKDFMGFFQGSFLVAGAGASSPSTSTES